MRRNQTRCEAAEAYEALHQMEVMNGADQGGGRAHHAGTELRGNKGGGKPGGKRAIANYGDAMIDIREYDVPYHMRWLIDTETRCGWWYDVKANAGDVTLTHRPDLLARGEVRVCAFDIETTKLPLKFPDAEFDQVFMISYMLDGQGYLIINSDVVGADVDDFEYSPKPEYPGPISSCGTRPDEAALLRRWFDHMRETRPCVYVTYNGDFFDWPFVETSAEKQRHVDVPRTRVQVRSQNRRVPLALRAAPRRVRVGEARLVPPRGVARPESGHEGQARVQPRGG